METMAIELPDVIAAYFAADRYSNPEATAQCFTEGAVVRDEGKTYTGRNEIRRWKAEASTKYTYTAEPIAIEAEAGHTVVTSHVAGNFPGSPVDLRYRFALRGEKIAGLEITL
jgi:myo-inositol-hexaphosphate 3-phosphohydrolase